MRALDDIIDLFAHLPGLGPRSARKIALHLLKKRHLLLPEFIEKLKVMSSSVHQCKICGNYDEYDICEICSSEKRDKSVICVVNDIADLWAIEHTGGYKGVYHVLGGLLSAIDGVTPVSLRLDDLKRRVSADNVKEIIMALPVTIEGQTTLHYIAEMLKPCSVKITMLALGIPVGGELDYLDDGTILNAMKARNAV